MRPAGAFNNIRGNATGKSLTPAQRKQLEQDIERNLMGPANAARPLILDGLEFQEMSMSAKDLDWLEGRRDADRIIALSVGCPPLILGIPGDSTYSNYEEANLSLVRDSAIPLAQSLIDELNCWIVPAFEEGLRLVIDRKKIPALASIYAQEVQQVGACEFMTTDEKRGAIGLPQLNTPASGQVFVSSSLVPLDSAGEEMEESEIEDDDKGAPLAFLSKKTQQLGDDLARISAAI